jgi:hypothetical protein
VVTCHLTQRGCVPSDSSRDVAARWRHRGGSRRPSAVADAGSAIVRLYAPFAPVPLLAGARRRCERLLSELRSAISCGCMGPLSSFVRRLRGARLSTPLVCDSRMRTYCITRVLTCGRLCALRVCVCVLRTHHCCRGAVALLNSAARGHVTAMACYAPAGCTISGVALCAGHLMRCDVMCFGAKSRVPRGVLRLFLRVAAWRGRRRGRRSAARPVSENITVACELRSRRPAPWSRLRARRQLLPAREVHELAGVKRHRWWP